MGEDSHRDSFVVVVSGTTRVRFVVVDGESMQPGLSPGDRLLVLPLRPRVGDVVALRDPREPSRVLVKRVVAIDVDGIDVRGDNRNASTDSRTFGRVPRDRLLGRAVYRYAPATRAGRVQRYR
jgi:nickel-type superoxide dismutase maturation protease